MDKENWKIVEAKIDQTGICPIISVVPDNLDPRLEKMKDDSEFWGRVRGWQDKGWKISLQGLHHCLRSCKGQKQFLYLENQTEFVGDSLEIQKRKIIKGNQTLKVHGVKADLWSAPAHTFDSKTLLALNEATEIRMISDGLSIYPYHETGFFWLPQQLNEFSKKKYGIWTVKFEPSQMCDSRLTRLLADIDHFENDLVRIGEFDEIVKFYKNRKRSLEDLTFENIHNSRRKLINGLHGLRVSLGA